MAEYRLAVQIGVEPDLKWFSDVTDRSFGGFPQYLRAAGTYVEIESVGELFFDADHRQKQVDENPFGLPLRDDWTWGPDTWGIEATPDASGRWTLPVSGRPLVLLAVGGGDQVFHHWEGDCQDQGARCELPEPVGRLVADSIDVYAKAVFVKGPWADVTHFQPLEEGKVNPRTRRPLPPH